MKDKLIQINYTAKLTPIKPINEQFTLCKCYVMATGLNRNKTIISKESVENALPTLFNIPVVGHLFVDEDGAARIGGHDMEIERTDDGKLSIRVVTVPFGVVPQQDNVVFEDVVESDGVTNTYLVADIILWTGRYPELLDAKYGDEVYFAQSMEILPSQTIKRKEGLEIREFGFSALCLLGKSDDPDKNVEPCFESARVEPYKYSEDDNLTGLFAEFKEQLAMCYSTGNVGEGGKEALNKELIEKILLEFGLAKDTVLSFEVAETMTEDELREKIKETYVKEEAKQNETEVKSEDTEVVTDTEETKAENVKTEEFELNEDEVTGETLMFAIEKTFKESRAELAKAVDKQCNHTNDSYKYYYLLDFDSTYVYAYYATGKIGSDDVECTVRIPYAFIEEQPILDTANAVEVRQVWLTKEDEDKLSADKAQLDTLVQYKEEKESEEKRQAYSAVISEFSDLGEIEEYKLVVKDALNFASIDALKEKLYAIRGKHATGGSKKPLDKVRIPIDFEKDEDSVTAYMKRMLAK